MIDDAYYYCRNLPNSFGEQDDQWHFCHCYGDSCSPVGSSTTYPVSEWDIEVGPRIPTPEELISATVVHELVEGPHDDGDQDAEDEADS